MSRPLEPDLGNASVGSVCESAQPPTDQVGWLSHFKEG